jgi:hypothetical protein
MDLDPEILFTRLKRVTTLAIPSKDALHKIGMFFFGAMVEFDSDSERA